MIDARFGHVNVIARDWRRLSDFYQTVFGCTFVPPERDTADRTGRPGAASRARVTWCYVTDPEGNIVELQS